MQGGTGVVETDVLGPYLRAIIALSKVEYLQMDELMDAAGVTFYVAETIRDGLVKHNFATAEVKTEGKRRFWEIRPTAKCKEAAKLALGIKSLSESHAPRERTARRED